MDLALRRTDDPGTPGGDRPAEPDPRVGSTLGPYQIFECIGDGGMGQVYRAEHVHLQRPAAIKFLLPRFAVDQEAVSRFLEEARTVNRVRHANLIDIHDYFVDHERALVAYVMELLTGRALRDAMMKETLGLARILPIARQIASALQAVHAVGIVHRDLKPENIFLVDGPDDTDLVKILDFGVAKFTRGQVTHKTQAGMAMGSPWYMAPEQARGALVDHRADVYSFGVILYELLTGRVPFPGETYANVLAGHLTKPPPPMRRADGWVPPDAIAGVVLRCLEKEPTARPHDMELAWQELAEAAGPQFAGGWATPASLRVGRTPRPSRVTLPLTGSDSPFRYTPVEGAPAPSPAPAVVPPDATLPVVATTPSSIADASAADASLPVAIPPQTVIEIEIEPSKDTAPTPVPAAVLRAGAEPPPRSLRRWAVAGLLLGLGAVAWISMRQVGASATPPVSALAVSAPVAAPAPPVAPPAPVPPAAVDPAPPAAEGHGETAVQAPPPAEPAPPAATPPAEAPPPAEAVAPKAEPKKSRKPTRATTRPPTSRGAPASREGRDVILDPFQ